MIRSHFGLDRMPFDKEGMTLLAAQQEVFDTLRVHTQQGGLCLVLGEPGTGKSVLKEAICRQDKKRVITPVVNRTLHTYHSTLRILCQAFQIDVEGRDFACEKKLIEEAQRINSHGKMLAIVIDDAHLMSFAALRKVRLLLEDFPKNHNLILMAQPGLLTNLALSVNEDIKSRVTYSVAMPLLTPDNMEEFIKIELDRAVVGHDVFSPEAVALIARSAAGAMRAARNLCIGSMLEAVRDKVRIVDLKQVNRVLLQPHWRTRQDMPF